MSKKSNRSPEGTLSIDEIHLTFTSHDGKVIREYVSPSSFFILDSDSENLLSKKAAELLNLHADRISRDLDNWRTNVSV